MSGTRANIAKSWSATRRTAERTGCITANAASAAGLFLELAGGDPRRAIALLPKDEGNFFALVATHLALVVEEERGAHLKVINGGRG